MVKKLKSMKDQFKNSNKIVLFERKKYKKVKVSQAFFHSTV